MRCSERALGDGIRLNLQLAPGREYVLAEPPGRGTHPAEPGDVRPARDARSRRAHDRDGLPQEVPPGLKPPHVRARSLRDSSPPSPTPAPACRRERGCASSVSTPPQGTMRHRPRDGRRGAHGSLADDGRCVSRAMMDAGRGSRSICRAWTARDRPTGAAARGAKPRGKARARGGHDLAACYSQHQLPLGLEQRQPRVVQLGRR